MPRISEREYHLLKSRGPCNEDHPEAIRRKARRRKVLTSRLQKLEPMEQLPPEYIISTKTTCHRPPRLHYCISVTSHQLYDYAVKNHLMPEQYIRDRSHLYCGMDEAVNELERLSGAMLSLEAPGWSAEDSWLVARYTNYNYSYHMKTGPPDDDVFALIRRELATTATPKWYHVT